LLSATRDLFPLPPPFPASAVIHSRSSFRFRSTPKKSYIVKNE
jgi:hypothetical protein